MNVSARLSDLSNNLSQAQKHPTHASLAPALQEGAMAAPSMVAEQGVSGCLCLYWYVLVIDIRWPESMRRRILT